MSAAATTLTAERASARRLGRVSFGVSAVGGTLSAAVLATWLDATGVRVAFAAAGVVALIVAKVVTGRAVARAARVGDHASVLWPLFGASTWLTSAQLFCVLPGPGWIGHDRVLAGVVALPFLFGALRAAELLRDRSDEDLGRRGARGVSRVMYGSALGFALLPIPAGYWAFTGAMAVGAMLAGLVVYRALLTRLARQLATERRPNARTQSPPGSA